MLHDDFEDNEKADEVFVLMSTSIEILMIKSVSIIKCDISCSNRLRF